MKALITGAIKYWRCGRISRLLDWELVTKIDKQEVFASDQQYPHFIFYRLPFDPDRHCLGLAYFLQRAFWTRSKNYRR